MVTINKTNSFKYSNTIFYYIMKKNKKKPITVNLSEEGIAILESLGGKTKGIESLIENYRTGAKKEGGSIEEQFYDLIMLPADSHVRETYKTFVEMFLREGARQAAIDYIGPKLSGYVGYDFSTIRKHFKKMSATRFIKASGTLHSPTIRLREGVEEEDFLPVYNNFVYFIQAKGQYKDISEDLWGEKKRKEALERMNSAKPITGEK